MQWSERKGRAAGSCGALGTLGIVKLGELANKTGESVLACESNGLVQRRALFMRDEDCMLTAPAPGLPSHSNR